MDRQSNEPKHFLSYLYILVAFASGLATGLHWARSADTETAPPEVERDQVLNELRDAINTEYGFLNGGPRINQGPCPALAISFWEEWNRRFNDKVSLGVVMTPKRDFAHHVLVRFADGSAFDGGNGVMSPQLQALCVADDILVELKDPNRPLLEHYFGKLDRKFPRCPDYDEQKTRKIIAKHLDRLLLLRNTPRKGAS